MDFLAAIDRSDPDGLRDVIERARAREHEVGAPIWGVRARAGEGFLRALEGEPAAGLAGVDSALVHYNWQTEPFRFRWMEWLARYPETRARAMPVLEIAWAGHPVFDVPRLYVLGRTLEAEGDTGGAVRSYQRFVDILSGADEGLLVQARVDSARAAILRLEAVDPGS